MTTREELHRLVDKLAEEQAELARGRLKDLLSAAGDDEAPLSGEALASLGRDFRILRMLALSHWRNMNANADCELRADR